MLFKKKRFLAIAVELKAKYNVIFLFAPIVISVAVYLYTHFITGSENSNNMDQTVQINPAKDLSVDEKGLSHLSALIKTVHGNLSIKFYAKEAPNTTKRIIKLIQDGFYDGLKFHKVIPGFVLQTGDPTDTGDGGSGQELRAELNKIQHIKGTIGMARSENLNSASSQFYISLERLPHLDQKYTVFAQVVTGIDILDKIVIEDRILSFTLKESLKEEEEE